MASIPPTHSIADLERLLEAKGQNLARLLRAREWVQKQIDDLDREMQSAVSWEPIEKRRGRSPLQNDAPLKVVLHKILAKHRKGLTLVEITAKAAEAGYQSQAKNFSNVIYQYLYRSSAIELNRHTGIYSLKK